jgi:hypothetical protein
MGEPAMVPDARLFCLSQWAALDTTCLKNEPPSVLAGEPPQDGHHVALDGAVLEFSPLEETGTLTAQRRGSAWKRPSARVVDPAWLFSVLEKTRPLSQLRHLGTQRVRGSSRSWVKHETVIRIRVRWPCAG